jgi:hypothetical protein
VNTLSDEPLIGGRMLRATFNAYAVTGETFSVMAMPTWLASIEAQIALLYRLSTGNDFHNTPEIYKLCNVRMHSCEK